MLEFLNTFRDNVVTHFGRFFWIINTFGIYLIVCGIILIWFDIWISLDGKVKTRKDLDINDDE